MNLRQSFIPDAQAPKLMQPGDGPLDDPAGGAQSTAVRHPPLGEQGANPAPPQLPPMRLGVVGAIPLDDRRARPGPAAAPAYRRNPVDQGQQLGDIVGIRAGQGRREREPLRVAEDMVFAAGFAAVRGVRPGFFPPWTARTEELSMMARDQSSWLAPCS